MEGVRGETLTREGAFRHVWNVYDTIHISVAAKTEAAILSKLDINLRIRERNIACLLDNYMHRCQRRNHRVHGKSCPVTRNYIVVDGAEIAKAAGIKGLQSKRTACYNLRNGIETICIRQRGRKRHVVTEYLHRSICCSASIHKCHASGNHACTRQYHVDRNNLSITGNGAVYIGEDAAIAWMVSAHRKCSHRNIGDSHP